MRRLRLGFMLMLAIASASTSASAEASLASAPVDLAMFRDGEVRRSAEPYGSWTLVCDAILRLGHRFCSLRAAPLRVGTATLTLTVSTGDDGRPAALLRLPFGLSLPYGVRVEAVGSRPSRAPRHVPVALCSGDACEAVWSLDATEIAALRTGQGLRIAVQGWRFHAAGGGDPQPVSAILPGQGFAQAVDASLK